jgi:hypothetical protein
MEEVAHRIDEDPARFTPPLRFLEALRMQRELEAIREILVKALGKNFGVAVFAARTDLVATYSRVPGLIRPLYRCVRARHAPPPTLDRKSTAGIL